MSILRAQVGVYSDYTKSHLPLIFVIELNGLSRYVVTEVFVERLRLSKLVKTFLHRNNIHGDNCLIYQCSTV